MPLTRTQAAGREIFYREMTVNGDKTKLQTIAKDLRSRANLRIQDVLNYFDAKDQAAVKSWLEYKWEAKKGMNVQQRIEKCLTKWDRGMIRLQADKRALVASPLRDQIRALEKDGMHAEASKLFSQAYQKTKLEDAYKSENTWYQHGINSSLTDIRNKLAKTKPKPTKKMEATPIRNALLEALSAFEFDTAKILQFKNIKLNTLVYPSVFPDDCFEIVISDIGDVEHYRSNMVEIEKKLLQALEQVPTQVLQNEIADYEEQLNAKIQPYLEAIRDLCNANMYYDESEEILQVLQKGNIRDTYAIIRHYSFETISEPAPVVFGFFLQRHSCLQQAKNQKAVFEDIADKLQRDEVIFLTKMIEFREAVLKARI